jgi:hypothetical protein
VDPAVAEASYLGSNTIKYKKAHAMTIIMSKRTLSLTILAAFLFGAGAIALGFFALEQINLVAEPWWLKGVIGFGLSYAGTFTYQFVKSSRRKDELEPSATSN